MDKKQGNLIDAAIYYKKYELDLNKIKAVTDCGKILKFLCDNGIKPLPEGLTYAGFDEIREYFI